MPGYRDVARDLRRRIEEGEFPPGSLLPSISELMSDPEYGVAKQTIRAALAELANQGWVSVRPRASARVRGRTPVKIPFSRYGRVRTPGSEKGPWETACAAQGLDGYMKPTTVARVPATEELAMLLGLAPGTELVHRHRHAMLRHGDDGERSEEIVQVQDAWYPAVIADAVGISGNAKIVGGVLKQFTGEFTPSDADERVTSGNPTTEEARELEIGAKVPVLRVQRLTRSGDTVLEVLRVVAPADRIELVYDNLPLPEGAAA